MFLERINNPQKKPYKWACVVANGFVCLWCKTLVFIVF